MSPSAGPCTNGCTSFPAGSIIVRGKIRPMVLMARRTVWLCSPGGLLALLAGTNEVMVNSLHSQGIDRPGPMLRVEAVAPDGQIEAVSLPEARFVVGVQWHPEYKALENPFSSALFSAFARACDAAAAGISTTIRAA